MAKLRKWVAYRKIERPYTRFSKVRGKAFVKSRPGKSLVKYEMGDTKCKPEEKFDICLSLVSKDDAQIRANALEAGRITTLKKLETNLGIDGFRFSILTVPHHVIRENKLAAGAGADRLSTGMKHSFGKTIGTSAQVKAGKVIARVYVNKKRELFVRKILKGYSKKLPVRTTIVLQ